MKLLIYCKLEVVQINIKKLTKNLEKSYNVLNQKLLKKVILV